MRKRFFWGRRVARGRVFIVLIVLVSGASFAQSEVGLPVAGASKVPIDIPSGSGVLKEVLGCEADDGSFHLAAVTPSEMPWRVSIGMPRNSPQHGSRQEGRAAAIAAMRQWERAIQSKLPWFALEFVKKDRDAPIQITWKRRTTGSAQGRAGPTCWKEGARLQAGGRMKIAVQACPTCGRLSVDEIEVLIAHEFGHILGLGHCLECDSAMNYSWQTTGRVLVTQVDVDAVVRRFAMAEGGSGDLMDTGQPEEPRNRLEAEGIVDLAKSTTAIHASDWSCDTPFPLKRSCSKRKGPKKNREIGGLDVMVAGTKDGTVLLITPVAFGLHNDWPATDRFYAVLEAAEEKGLTAIGATAMVSDGYVLGYWIQFDADAWSALDL